ncbi:class I SAM-dependent methyltransferase [Reyranella sp. CPCC 100927]|uniref:class I SAM-dependent methyltransferase n=1 Tax=Reyranella sp. CPCC 100927 TaxID=2599616 RepID=UPI0011B3F3CC|nr:class I SAM-dependent methyltransferase [Reyranella sp. CPCC 100927]TWT13707.1 class I SAM-dependent methyltransferase [Reyranella sp. CPCC 100927]
MEKQDKGDVVDNAIKGLGLTPQETAAAFEPWVIDRMPVDSPRWRGIVAREFAKSRRRLLKRRLLGWWPGVKRTQDVVDQRYSHYWARRIYPSLDAPCGKGDTSWIEWRHEGFVARRGAIARPLLTYVGKLFDILNPASVLEAGAGNGINLFVLASSFPGTRFTGLELTAPGVARMRQVIAEAMIPDALATYTPLSLRDRAAPGRVAVSQGSAAAMPYPDKHFDVALTITALEQMNAISAQALAELRRVARRYVVMVEPFPDFNTTTLRTTYIRSKDYWSVPVARLASHGLRPVAVYDDVPHKLRLGVGIVVAAV